MSTVDAAGTPREELEVIRILDDEWFVIQRTTGKVLCYGQRFFVHQHYVVLYRPILFKSYSAADKWVKDGCMADIQEGLSILDVRFTNEMTVCQK